MESDTLDSKKVYKASKALDLGERASIKDIKKRYRDLLKKWHPDKCKESPERCKERTDEIVTAYEVIMTYCENYNYSFTEKDIFNNLPTATKMREKWEKQYGKDPLWS